MKVIEWLGSRLRLLDQSELPQRIAYLELTTYGEVVDAIKSLKVRGAPAIGIAAAWGIALGAQQIKRQDMPGYSAALQKIMDTFARARPTAVNLSGAVSRLQNAISGLSSAGEIQDALLRAAGEIERAEEKAMRSLSRHGSRLLKDNYTVLTHCNTGRLATGVSYGTALGVIQAAVEQGKRISVYADETRPVLQGARLTAWELMQAKIPVTLITDSMAGHLMAGGKIDCVMVGADRIAANGDTANKIGTYSLAVLARAHGVPFYVAAPTSSIDMGTRRGGQIIIEERGQDEVTCWAGMRVAPPGVRAYNPAFDVTPHRYIEAIITEKGVIEKPYRVKLKAILQEGKKCPR